LPISPLFVLNWQSNLIGKDRQQAPPTLTLFARPRAKFKDKSNHEHNILRYMAYMKVIPTHSLYKWECWCWLTCFLELLKSEIVLETKSSSQFHILATWSFWKFFLKRKHSLLCTSQVALSNHSMCMHPYQGIAMFCLHLLLKRFMWSFK
jgi:hypothetical protein